MDQPESESEPESEPEPDIVAETPEIFVFTVSNHPNPFNPETTISFTIPTNSNVSIEIYNIRGQRVRTLLDGSSELRAGHHDIVWNGRDDTGRSMSSGIYLYHIVAGENVATKRMLLMK
jgi:flagellar hook assembly protein FlgD